MKNRTPRTAAGQHPTTWNFAVDTRLVHNQARLRIDRLVERGHVTREVGPLDRRRILIRPTVSGRRLWETSLAEGIDAESSTFEALTQRDLVQLNSLLRNVLRHIEADR